MASRHVRPISKYIGISFFSHLPRALGSLIPIFSYIHCQGEQWSSFCFAEDGGSRSPLPNPLHMKSTSHAVRDWTTVVAVYMLQELAAVSSSLSQPPALVCSHLVVLFFRRHRSEAGRIRMPARSRQLIHACRCSWCGSHRLRRGRTRRRLT